MDIIIIFFLQCIYYWPEEGRAYVKLGKILSKQNRTAEARAVYEKGCQATQGENPYIWQVIRCLLLLLLSCRRVVRLQNHRFCWYFCDSLRKMINRDLVILSARI